MQTSSGCRLLHCLYKLVHLIISQQDPTIILLRKWIKKRGLQGNTVRFLRIGTLWDSLIQKCNSIYMRSSHLKCIQFTAQRNTKQVHPIARAVTWSFRCYTKMSFRVPGKHKDWKAVKQWKICKGQNAMLSWCTSSKLCSLYHIYKSCSL